MHILDVITSVYRFSKYTKIVDGWGYTPDPTGELTALPRPPSWVLEGLFLRPLFLIRGEERAPKWSMPQAPETIAPPLFECDILCTCNNRYYNNIDIVHQVIFISEENMLTIIKLIMSIVSLLVMLMGITRSGYQSYDVSRLCATKILPWLQRSLKVKALTNCCFI